MKHDLSLVPFDTNPAELGGAARAAEELGFDGVWTYDHVSGTPFGGSWTLDPWTVLGAVAAATERILVGPLVVNSIVRHPAHIALAAATLQQLSGGRAMLGMGAGAGPDRFGEELRMVGMPRHAAAERRAIVEESIATIRALWSGKPHVEKGRFPLEGATGFLAPDPQPPIIVGANGPKMAALAGRVAEGINLHSEEPDLVGLVETACRSAVSSRFLVTVEAPLEPYWISGNGYECLGQIGVDRVIYRWHASMGYDTMERTSRLLLLT